VEARQKFQSPVLTGIFVGYEAHSTFYRIYFLDTGKVTSFRDVVFNEQPLLNSMKRRHNLLHEEVLNWSGDESDTEEDADGGELAGGAAGGGPSGGGSAELPAPAGPAPAGPSRPSVPRSPVAKPRVTFTENMHEDRLKYHQSRPKRFDMFEDSDSESASDDDTPPLAEPVVPPAPAVMFHP
jgi:hypothetical protein